jgi:NhaP-type Na+/H+ or K+/H+ antiporter
MCGYNSGITLKQLIFISYAGMIRGAVAFGLVLRVDKAIPQRSVIVTTALSLVVFTTVVLGSTVATVGKCLLVPENLGSKKDAHVDKDQSSHEVVRHANEEEEEGGATPVIISGKANKYSGCVRMFKAFDLAVIKPTFIYKYDTDTQKRAKEFMELIGVNNGKIQELVENDKSFTKSKDKSRLNIEMANKSHGKITPEPYASVYDQPLITEQNK